MKILALEFSSPCRSVAVLDGPAVLTAHAEVVGEFIPPLRLVEQTLAAAKVGRDQIGCVAVGLGPGSYNGIRGAIALAQGWQLATSVKLLGVNSADCIAAQAQAEKIFGRVNVVIDAQRSEFYLATYEISERKVINISALKIVSQTELKFAAQENLLVGPEISRWFAGGRDISPSATALGRLAETRNDFIPGEQLEPVYLRTTSFVKTAPARIL